MEYNYDVAGRRLLFLEVHTLMATEERLKTVASSALYALFSSRKAQTPIASLDLLALVIASGPTPSGPGTDLPLKFRLTDLSRFERILGALSEFWEFGKLTLLQGGSELTVSEVRLGSSCRNQATTGRPHGRKRKRVVDEEADSAAGNAQEEEEELAEAEELDRRPAPSTLDSLSVDMKEVYSLLQQGTAKGRLLAEQVCCNFRLYRR